MAIIIVTLLKDLCIEIWEILQGWDKITFKNFADVFVKHRSSSYECGNVSFPRYHRYGVTYASGDSVE